MSKDYARTLADQIDRDQATPNIKASDPWAFSPA